MSSSDEEHDQETKLVDIVTHPNDTPCEVCGEFYEEGNLACGHRVSIQEANIVNIHNGTLKVHKLVSRGSNFTTTGRPNYAPFLCQ